MNISKNIIKQRCSLIIIVLILCLSKTRLNAQDSISINKYKQAVSFLRENLINKKVFNLRIEPHFLKDSTGFWYIHHAPAIKKYRKYIFKTNETKDFFDHNTLAAKLSQFIDEEISADELPVNIIEDLGNETFEIEVKGQHFVLNVATSEISNTSKKTDETGDKIDSPNKKWSAYTKDYNLFVTKNQDSTITQLSFDGRPNYEYASWYAWGDIMEGENGVRPKHFGLQWSKNGNWVYANIVDLRVANKMYLLDWSIDSLYRPKLLSYYRGSPGDSTMVYLDPVFFDMESKKMVKPNLPKATHINPISVQWSKDPNKVFLEFMSRGYQNLTVFSFNLKTEKLDTLYKEQSSTNIDNFTKLISEDDGFMLYLSEKNGMRQLYKLDLNSKENYRFKIGSLYVTSIEGIDSRSKKIFFTASGLEEANNPYQQFLYSVSFNGEDLKQLTPEILNHDVSLSPDFKYVVDNMSDLKSPTKTVVRNLNNGKIIEQISETRLIDLDNWSPPEVFTALARDGKTINYGAIWKPTDFDKTKKYPLIEYSYTGPHTQLFPKDFTRAMMLQNMAELGFICMVFDGLGSSGRSKDYHNYSYKNLGGNLEDHVIAIKELGENYPFIDIEKVGIYGHSAGGYDAAHALLAYPETYKVAVASSADHDHRMEKAWWPEMYMGWPVDEAYHEQSNITMASNLKGKLLITHGGIDENVNPSATFKLAEALIKADKQFDMMIFPSQRHGYRGVHQDYFTKLRWNYFIEHLKELKPLWDFELKN